MVNERPSGTETVLPFDDSSMTAAFTSSAAPSSVVGSPLAPGASADSPEQATEARESVERARTAKRERMRMVPALQRTPCHTTLWV